MRPPTIAIVLALITTTWCRAELVDITQEGRAAQSSEWNGGQYPAALAVDGNPDTFSHTSGTGGGDWWELRFPASYEIRRVHLAMRNNCCGGRLTGATLRLLDEEGDSVFDNLITDPGSGQTVEFEAPPGTIARTVRVGFEDGATNPGQNSTYLHLGEVEVFAHVDLLPSISFLRASPAEISSGQLGELRWETTNADTTELSGTGDVPHAGSVLVTPASSTTYTLVATNEYGSRSQSVTIIVDELLLPVRLSEFMADNSRTITRSDGSSPDWIELWNPNPVAIDLEGYTLTDDPDNPARYRFGSRILGPNQFLVVDAAHDSLDGVPATGFRLNQAAGSYLALRAPAGHLLQEFHYPRQREDISFGVTSLDEERFFLNPSPGGAPVTGTVAGFVADTRFSVRRGFYARPQTVSISTATPLADIYVTTDGSPPSPANPRASLYEGPIAVSTTSVLRAAAFREDYLPTNIDTHSYLFPEDVPSQSSRPRNFPQAWVPNLNGVQRAVPALSHFGMDPRIVESLPLVDQDGEPFDLPDALLDIPSMSLVMNINDLLDRVDGLHVNARNRGHAWERPASIEFFDPATGESIQAECGIRMHGGWNRFPEMLKKSMRLYFRSEYGDAKLKWKLFPDSPTDEFDRILLRSGNGKAWPSPWRALSGAGNSLERTTYLRDQLMRDLQGAMGHDHVAGTFVHLYVNGHYWGLYNPVERPDEHFASSHFGGQDEDYDVVKWIRGTGHVMAAGTSEGWDELISLTRGGPVDQARFEAIAARLDLPNFIDYMLLNYFAGNVDWVDSNAYALRDRAHNGPFRFYCWDSEETFLSLSRDSTEQFVPDTSTEIHRALRANLEYQTLFGDRARRHLFHDGALTPAKTKATLSRRVLEIDRAIVGESARWGGLMRPTNPYDRTDWRTEIQNLRTNYFRQRVTTVLSQLRADRLYPNLEPPVFSPMRGGEVAGGFALSLSPPDGQTGRVYFTTDGTDPRAMGGGLSPSAILFSSLDDDQLAIQEDTLVRTRLRVGSNWSALEEGLFLVGNRAHDLHVSEIMYHPAPPYPNDAEFLELHNRGTTTHELRDLRITGGIEIDFATAGLHQLAPGERLILARNAASFRSVWPGIPVAGLYAGALGNEGDRFSLEQRDGSTLWTLEYDDDDPWPQGVDGDGHSLVFAGGDASSPASWRPSVLAGGTPGSTDTIAYEGQDLLGYALSGIAMQQGEDGQPELLLTTILGADHAIVSAQWSLDLVTWSSDNLALARQVALDGGRARETWRFSGPAPAQAFLRAVVTLRDDAD